MPERQERVPVRALLGAGGLALLLFLCLQFVATSPQASVYTFQAVTGLLILLVAYRLLQARASAIAEAPAVPGRRWELWAALALGVGVFVWILPLYFVGEDFWMLRWSRQPPLDVLGEVLRHGYGQKGNLFRPVAALTLALDYRLWELWPAGWHLTSLLFSLSAVLGVYGAGRSLGLGRRESGTAALLFSCLPVHVEALARLAMADQLLATSFVLWALVLYVRFRRQGHWASYAGALGLFLLAVLSNEVAFVFPGLLIALELFVLPARRFRPVAGFIATALLAFTYRWLTLGGIGGHRGEVAFYNVGLHSLLAVVIRAPAQSLFGLNWVQPPRLEVVLLASLAAGLLGGLALGAKLETPGRRWAAFWGLWMMMSVVPLHSLAFYGPDLHASHRLYLCSVGLCFLLAFLVERLQPPRLAAAGKVLLVLVFAAGLLHNLQAYRWACGLSEKVNAELLRLEPSPPPGAVFIFHQAPRRIRGVIFFGGGGRVQFAYGRDDLAARLEGRGQTHAERPEIHLRWTGKPDALLEPVAQPVPAEIRP